MVAMNRFAIARLFFVVMFCKFVVLHSSMESYKPFYHLCDAIHSNNLQTDLKTLLSNLNSEAKSSGFSKTSVNTGSRNQINGLMMCFKDSLRDNCLDCLGIATKNATAICPGSTNATFTYAECFLRYSKDENFFGTLTLNISNYYFNLNDVNSSTLLNKTVPELFKLLRQQAMSSPELYANSSQIDPGLNQMVYGFVQCTKDLNHNDCDLCLRYAVGNLTNQNRVPKGVRVSSPNCYIRYELYPFSLLSFNSLAPAPDPSQPIPPPPSATTGSRSGPRTMRVKVIAISAFGAFLCITLASICFWRMRRTKQTDEQLGSVSTRKSRIKEEISLDGSVQGDFRVFLLSELIFSTCNFSEDNKLGGGGFGQVYKGILPDGKEIAVKRLAGNSSQGFPEFKIEVELLAKLEHKNLVKLHGYCMERNEKLLCYEYLPSKSLDVVLFANDKIKREKLPWQTRYKIIEGISSGLQYLHKESGLKIVHRDLKPNNILLDGDMNPKISDFGLARLFQDDQSHVVTSKFAGTYGYLAPEYAMELKYSEKSDVYSYGIMLLEIVTARRNNRSFSDNQNASSQRTYVWQHWERGEVELLKDPALEDICLKQLSRCIHIGLLCVQHNPNNRPYIDAVNRALNDDSVALPAVPSLMNSQEYLLNQISLNSTSDNNITPGDSIQRDKKEFGHSMSSNDIAGDKYVRGIEVAAMPPPRNTT